jgi:hypothetical protein
MSTHYDDLNEVLRRVFPQGYAVLRHEHGAELLQFGARQLVGDARLAVEVLGAKGARRLAHALHAVGERHQCVAERMLELAEEKASGAESAQPKASSRCNTESET